MPHFLTKRAFKYIALYRENPIILNNTSHQIRLIKLKRFADQPQDVSVTNIYIYIYIYIF